MSKITQEIFFSNFEKQPESNKKRPSIAKAVFLSTRPKTLIATLAPILACSAFVASRERNFDIGLSFYALLTVLFLQIATNLFNDAIDFKKGTDTPERLGPKRVTAEGWLSQRTVIFLGIFSCLLAVCFSWPLLEVAGLPGFVLGVFCLFFTYGYTGGPFPLSYLGLGEVFVVLFLDGYAFWGSEI